MFIVLNSAYRPQKIIPNQINTTVVILENKKTPGDSGAYHLTENLGNSGWKVNCKVTFRKFQPKIEEYVLR